ncbi:MAG: energy-coupling factor transporter transmembrane protein EcfT [Clostridia bacterium]|nr:energy-coupling factor transporter transmembrane protein EcfT [Clostridia bacterium]
MRGGARPSPGGLHRGTGRRGHSEADDREGDSRLKDITLGQFFPGDSLIHRFDPRVKLIALLLYMVELFLVKTLFGFVFMAALLALAVLISRIPMKLMFRAVRPLLLLILFTSLLNLFYTKGDTLFRVWKLTATWQGLELGLFMVLRISLLVLSSSLLTYTTSPIMLTDAMERLLSPLKALHVPVGELAMMMTIALRFIPVLVEETDKIMSAQKARGADFESGGILKRAKAMVPILVPLFISAFRRADELAVAMECRCYHTDGERTRLKSMAMARRDHVLIAVMLLLIPAILFGTNRVAFSIIPKTL